MSRVVPISRRMALRGLGVSIALPFLEAMEPRQSRASAADATHQPLRTAFVYIPNGVHMPDWTPVATGESFALPPILEPLRAMREEVLILSGLTLNPARALGDGGGDHARAMASFLTGRHPEKSDGARLRAGVSVDQLAARRVGGNTRFASLEIGCEGGRNSGECDHGYSCAYQSNLSWRDESTPVAKQVNPRLVFERLFGDPASGRSDADRGRAERRRKSLLDFVAEETGTLKKTLGAPDRHKLDEYLTGVREVEQRIERARPRMEVGSSGTFQRPMGIPNDYQEHLRVMADLLVLAFQSDLTRIATFVFANDGSNRSYRNVDVADGHHDLSHHGGDPLKQARIARINRFHLTQFAYLVDRLKGIKEGDGTLLDHSMILFGSGISDGNLHSHDHLPILLAGKAHGTVKPGRHLRFAEETPLTNLYVSMLKRMGVSVERFGDSTGELAGLA